MPMGFESGFRRRLHVVNTRPEHWENPAWDDTDFIRQVNDFKGRHRVWNEEGPIESLDVANPSILVLLKRTRDDSGRSLLLLNKDEHQRQSCNLTSVRSLLRSSLLAVSVQFAERPSALPGETSLPPAGFQILLSS